MQEPLQWLSTLNTGEWFSSLPKKLADALIEDARLFALNKGEALFKRGSHGDGIYCVLTGSIRITVVSPDGEEALLALLRPSHWFGEICLFDQAARTHDAWADSDSLLLKVPQNQLHCLLKEHPEYWQDFGRLLSQKVRELFSAVEASALLPATPLLASRILSMAKDLNFQADQDAHIIYISQEQLGLMLSLSRQTINKSLKELESVGAIVRSRGAVTICSAEKLLQLSRK